MSLSPGTSLGRYDVTSLLGEGGMGQVWQATDTQLNRQVALKILPDAFADDPDRLARFTREAQILASLNHPNIAAIYGIEQSDDTRALVLELVEGPTLADRISQGPIPLDEALPIAKQIAEALEAAHEQGVIHRDLKPANIKVKADGTVKVLDFGLAKALAGDAQGPDLSQSPTMTASMGGTREGVILGTAAYMSPEQARGQTLDKRTDIWSFGCVLYEMLTGRAAFGGETLSDTIANVIEREPAWAALPANLPAVLAHSLRRCVRKNPRQRVHDVADVRLAMEDAFETTVTVETEAASAQLAGLLPWAVGVALGAVASSVVVWALLARPDSAPADAMRFAIAMPESAPLDFLPGIRSDLEISPDGTQIVYVSDGPAGPRLNLRPTGELIGGPLRGAEGGHTPFFSPDGEWIGFIDSDDRTLKRVPLLGGSPVTVTETPFNIFGAAWGIDDQIILASAQGLFSVPAGGGQPEVLANLDPERRELGYSFPSIIPGRHAVLFTIGTQTTLALELAVLDLDTGDVLRLGLEGFSPRYVSTGHLIYATEDGSVRAVPFDATSLAVTRAPVQLIEGVMVKTWGVANFGVSDTGTLVYALARNAAARQLVWVDQDGREDQLPLSPRAYVDPRVSPEGRRVAATIQSGFSGGQIWVFDAVDGRERTLTQGYSVRGLAWTPDGSRIIFGSSHDGVSNLYSVLADGSGEAEVLLESDEWDYPSSVTPDGSKVAFQRSVGGPSTNRREIWEMTIDGDEPAVPLLEGRGWRSSAHYSPDGKWLAYSANPTGALEVYVQSYPGLSGVQPVSVGGGQRPLWSADGSHLFYQGVDREMAISFEAEGRGPAGAPMALFELFPYAARPGTPGPRDAPVQDLTDAF